MLQIDAKEIDRRFDLHSPKTSDVSDQLDNLRAAFKGLALGIIKNTPAGREQALAITSLEESLYWAVGSVVRP
jgi:hypothetical protein